MRHALALSALLLSSSAAMAASECAMSSDQFALLKQEMYISKVDNTLGCRGELITETKFGDITTAMYRYPASDSSGGYQLMFQNRQLVGKTKAVR